VSWTDAGRERRLRCWLGLLGAGLFSGLLAALALTLAMGLLRAIVGVPSVPELIGDRVIPLFTLDQFFRLINRFRDGNGVKRAGISSVLIGQIVVGALAGIPYAVLVRRTPGGRTRAARIYLLALTVIAALLVVALLWPVLGTSYRGLPPGPAAVVTVAGVLLAFGAYGLTLSWAFGYITGRRARRGVGNATPPLSRRVLLSTAAGAGLALASGGVLRRLYDRSTLHYDGTRYQGDDLQPITPNDRFYTVTKNILDPEVARPLWRLDVTGHVDRPRSYAFDDLRQIGATRQEATLSCISNDVGDGLISNAIWTGVPLTTLLDSAGLRDGVVDIAFQAVDNYVDTIPLEKALDGTVIVAWEMNGAPLPQRHGYPVRVIVPGRFGEKSVKWVTRITAVDHHQQGFYARQGWGPSFVTQTLSRIDQPIDGAMVRPSSGPVAVKGIAFAGDRGVARVEISADGGQRWQPARLDYQSSRLAWVFWSADWLPPSPGDFQLIVRAIDGLGNVQTPERRGITPDGASGWHTIRVRVAG
jgi:DMSO/TMAO reductase YedYZ molybdopterin-dependent catalytic subunit